MPKTKPKKPTQTFGYASFSPDGKVEIIKLRLPDTQQEKEIEAYKFFVEKYNIIDEVVQITDVSKLPENDHDFKVKIARNEVLIQLTELVDRTFVTPLTEEQYRKGGWDAYVLKGSGEIPCGVNLLNRDNALKDCIESKILKNYASCNLPIWLVVFSTFPYETEFFEAGIFKISSGLQLARAYLATTNNNVFSQIWFTDLLTRPIKVWPKLNS